MPTSRAVRWSTVSGLHTGPAAIHHHGHQRGVQLALTTAGARALFGLPAAALAGELLELADAVPALRHLPEQVAEAPGTRAAATCVEAALLAALTGTEAPPPRPEVGHALARLTRGATVQQAADEVGYSRRHLTTLVRAEAGVAPKAFHRLARFERSHRLLRRQAQRGPGRARARRRRRRLRGPGAPEPRVGRPGRLHPDHVAARGVPIRPRRRRPGGGRLTCTTPTRGTR